jgi:hypothetical protein
MFADLRYTCAIQASSVILDEPRTSHAHLDSACGRSRPDAEAPQDRYSAPATHAERLESAAPQRTTAACAASECAPRDWTATKRYSGRREPSDLLARPEDRGTEASCFGGEPIFVVGHNALA